MSRTLFDLSGRVAVATGETGGIGHAIALGLAEAGADVAASSRRLEHLENVATEIEAMGRRSLRVSSDVLSRGSIEVLHETLLKEFGTVDILVSAAGITPRGPT
jgi:NADP-dependent 3-hydroxy acid dehydrogenase YdfG